MKLKKDTLIEGKVIKKGTIIKIVEAVTTKTEIEDLDIKALQKLANVDYDVILKITKKGPHTIIDVDKGKGEVSYNSMYKTYKAKRVVDQYPIGEYDDVIDAIVDVSKSYTK